jgi:O-antigen ligase
LLPSTCHLNAVNSSWNSVDKKATFRSLFFAWRFCFKAIFQGDKNPMPSMSIFNKQTRKRDLSAPASTGNLFWLLWTFLSIAPWILPTHTPPWPAFYSEWLWAVLLLALAIWAATAFEMSWAVQKPAVFLLLVAAIPLAQGAAGLFLFPAESMVVAAYVAGFAIAVGLGSHLYAACKYQAMDWLLAGLAVAAVISTGLALYQWWALEGLGLMVPSMAVGGGRAVANIGQPNNLSTLLVWGLVALWWAYDRKAITGLGVCIAALYLLLGIALTGSRTGWIQMALLSWSAVFFGPRQARGKRTVAVMLLAFWLAILVVALPYVSAALWESTPRTASQLASVGLRSKFWAMSIEAIWQKPWFGYGWNQTVLAQVALAKEYPNLGEAMGHSHNIVLDLLLWNGVPLGLILVALSTGWLARCTRIAQTEAHHILLTFLAVFLVHAMLELPHVFTYFLLPAGLVLGCLGAIASESPVFSIPRSVVGGCSLMALGALTLVFMDYGQTESYLTARGMLAARIVGAEMPVSPTIYILKPLQSALERIHTEPKSNMAVQDLDALRKASIRYPTSGAPFRYAKAAALNGRLEDANATVATICAMYSKSECEAARGDVISAQQ